MHGESRRQVPRQSRGHKSWKLVTWFVLATWFVCTTKFATLPQSLQLCHKVGVMEFGLYWAFTVAQSAILLSAIFSLKYSIPQVAWPPCLEHSVEIHNNISVTLNVLSTSVNLALQKVIPGHHHLNLLLLFNLEAALLLKQPLLTERWWCSNVAWSWMFPGARLALNTL